ncbi:hypothetical protein OIU78_001578 [Salix suchowensis]|nr:hypothetical protein OIU78_001578 [Salix suchowensis]
MLDLTSKLQSPFLDPSSTLAVNQNVRTQMKIKVRDCYYPPIWRWITKPRLSEHG